MLMRGRVVLMCLCLLVCGLCWETGYRARVVRPAPLPVTPAPSPVVTADFAVPVLMYHRICNLTPAEECSPLLRDLTVAPTAFDQQMAYLAANGFYVVTVEEIADALREHRSLPEKAIAITMDDGYRDNFSDAFPILQRYHFPATEFLVTATLQTPGHLAWRDIAEMRPLFNFQSHTVHHFDLTVLPPAELIAELAGAKATLEAALRVSITHLAYPSGAYNDTVMAAARACGYQFAWKKGGGPVTPRDDPYMLPRVRVRGDTTMEDFARLAWSGVYRERMGAADTAKT